MYLSGMLASIPWGLVGIGAGIAGWRAVRAAQIACFPLFILIKTLRFAAQLDLPHKKCEH